MNKPKIILKNLLVELAYVHKCCQFIEIYIVINMKILYMLTSIMGKPFKFLYEFDSLFESFSFKNYGKKINTID